VFDHEFSRPSAKNSYVAVPVVVVSAHSKFLSRIAVSLLYYEYSGN
jgi:hypothetical protein